MINLNDEDLLLSSQSNSKKDDITPEIKNLENAINYFCENAKENYNIINEEIEKIQKKFPNFNRDITNLFSELILYNFQNIRRLDSFSEISMNHLRNIKKYYNENAQINNTFIETNDVKNKIEKLTKENEKLFVNLENAKKIIEIKSQEIEQLKSDIKSRENLFLIESYKPWNNLSGSTIRLLDNYQIENRELKKVFEDKINDYQEEINKKTQTNINLKNKCNEIVNKNKKAMNVLYDEKCQELNKLKEKYEGLQKEFSEKDTYIKILTSNLEQKEKDNYNNRNNPKDNINLELEQKNKKIEELEGELAKKNEENFNLIMENGRLKSKLENPNKSIASISINSEYNRLKEENEHLKEKLQIFTEYINENNKKK